MGTDGLVECCLGGRCFILQSLPPVPRTLRRFHFKVVCLGHEHSTSSTPTSHPPSSSPKSLPLTRAKVAYFLNEVENFVH